MQLLSAPTSQQLERPVGYTVYRRLCRLYFVELTADSVTFALLGPVIIRGDGPHYLSRNELRDVLDSASFDV